MKNTKNLGTERKLPAGTYYIGDLCYVIPHDKWDEWLELTAVHDSNCKLIEYQDGFYEWTIEYDGEQITNLVGWHGTAHGDGLYYANYDGNISKHNKIYVDSGTIGIVSIAFLVSSGLVQHQELDKIMGGEYGIVHRFDDEFFCALDENPVFGYLEIQTSDDSNHEVWDGEDDE